MTTTLLLDGMHVPVELGGTSRRARLTIERDGSLRLRAAEDVASDELQSFLESRRPWIYRKLAEKEVVHREPVTKELVDGEGFLYLARSHQLRIADTDDGRVRLQRGRLVLPRVLASDGRGAIVSWYAQTGAAWLRPRLAEWSSRLRVAPRSLTVEDLGYRWGAAAADGRVRIHWATMQLRPELVAYVLAHELAHLREPHHGPTFWRLLERVLPDFDERKAALARTGPTIWLGQCPGDDEGIRSPNDDRRVP